MYLAFAARGFDMLASDVLAGERVRVMLARLWFWLGMGFVEGPIMGMITKRVVKWCLRLTGWAEVAYMTVVVLCLMLFAMAWSFVHYVMFVVATSSMWFVGLYVAFGVLKLVVIHGFSGLIHVIVVSSVSVKH